MKYNYTNLTDKATHASRSFFVYQNGDLFCQLKAYEFCIAKPNDNIVFKMSGANVRGKFVKNSGTGIILTDWTIERK